MFTQNYAIVTPQNFTTYILFSQPFNKLLEYYISLTKTLLLLVPKYGNVKLRGIEPDDPSSLETRLESPAAFPKG